MQASVAALVSVPKLPPETLAWLAAAEQAGGDAAGNPIPGLDASWNALPFLSVFADTFLGVASINTVHELGHRIVAGARSHCFACLEVERRRLGILPSIRCV